MIKRCMVFFSGYGEILEARVQRKNSQHQGCAFVKFASMSQAEEAMKELKEVFLPGGSAALQIKWADGEEERLGVTANTVPKLFVGSIPRNATEQNLRDVFSPFGEIEECYIMTDEEKQSKGCAFVKFKNCESALLAMRELNARACICGSDKPIEVRFADKKKPTERAPARQGPVFYECFAEGTNQPFFFNPETQQSQWERPIGAVILPQSQLGMHNSYSGGSGGQYGGHSGGSSGGGYLSKGEQQWGQNRQGPNGCNLFIFHLPNEWTVRELHQHFSQFGNMISARIMTDRESGRSKGFGFVSYDDPESAQRAIKTMNGVTISNKRLKVDLKKGDGSMGGGSMDAMLSLIHI
eukprot:TRINITY_DN4881_c0_g1_i12.p2 TRINITY_DN4881_c0_g1~~TRINITY_DN4881_c0_g1_i12.p2  ORF type:complete len:353 (-),score=58.05 TRINITY_DN4881_c0_g1_i12:61-1119(-)